MTFDKIEEKLKQNNFGQAEMMLLSYLDDAERMQKTLDTLRVELGNYDNILKKLNDNIVTLKIMRGEKRDDFKKLLISDVKLARNSFARIQLLISKQVKPLND